MNILRLYYKNQAWKLQVLNSIKHIVQQEFPGSEITVSEEQNANAEGQKFVGVSFAEMDTKKGIEVCKLINKEFINTVDYYPVM